MVGSKVLAYEKLVGHGGQLSRSTGGQTYVLHDIIINSYAIQSVAPAPDNGLIDISL